MQASAEDLVKDIVGQTSGFMPRDLRALIADAGANLISKKEKLEHGSSKHGSVESNSIEDHCEINDMLLDHGKENLLKALERSKKRNASALGTPKVKYNSIIVYIYLMQTVDVFHVACGTLWKIY